jgi:hypothetical protein
MNGPRVFGREPALWTQLAAAALGVLVGFGMPGLTDHQAAAGIAVINTGFGVWMAIRVRPVVPAVFTTFVAATFALLAAYGLDATQQSIAAVNILVLSALAFIARGQVSPDQDIDPAVLGRAERTHL